ncbi:MAG: type II toxin-antitoxin system VapC family toxin [Acidobacteriota bacterium]
MAVYFFDSSAVVKRYIIETGTTWIVGIVDPMANNRIYIARITAVEVVSAITRRVRNGSISISDGSAAIAKFRRDLTNIYSSIDIAPLIVAAAMQLAETHALRGYDAVQLATAIDVNTQWVNLGMPALTLVSADADLNAAAATEGLSIEDPNDHP